MFLIAAQDVCVKLIYAAGDYSPAQIACVRFGLSLLFLAPPVFAARKSRAALARLRPVWRAQVFRGVCLGVATLFFFAAIRKNPVPDALAVFFIEPVLVSLFAPFVLPEKFRAWRLWTALFAFAGALVILRPGAGAYDPSILWALATGVLFAFYMLATRALAFSSPPLISAFCTGVIAAVVCVPFAVVDWLAPAGAAAGWMLALGFFSACGHYCISKAYAYAEASALAPLNYTEIAAAILINFAVFAYLPQPIVWVGIAIITASGLYSLRRESAEAKAAESGAAAKITAKK